jgi:GMP synthase (glutamine-hydrolysing)
MALIGHALDEKDDRASAWAAARGIELLWSCPSEGGALPPVDEDLAAVIVYGGRFDVTPKGRWPFLADEARFIEACLARGTPLLGLCLGAQILADVLGAPVGPHRDGVAEYGYYRLIPSAAGQGVFGDDLMVLESHAQGWFELPAGALHLARTDLFPHQAFRYGDNAYALQFHPETSRATLKRWIARRGARNSMPGAFSAERQLADYLKYDTALGIWLHGFLDRWLPSRG